MSDSSGGQPSGWAVGFTMFAGSIMLVVGIFQFFEGLVAVANDNFYVVSSNYTFNIDTTAYGWTHMIIGIVVGLAGCGVLAGQTWARIVGIFVAALSMIANFLFIPYYPLWSLLIVALNVAIIWALSQRTLGD
jgi:hypothetical protein